MRETTRSRLLAEFRAMRRTGRQRHPDGERPIGTALAARLPRIIAAAAERVKCGARQGRVSS